MTLAHVVEQHSGRSEKDRLVQGEQILSDKANGMRISAIMEKYGLSRPTIHRRINQAIQARLALTVDQYREEQNSILDEQMQRLQRHMDAAVTMIELGNTTGDSDLIDRGLQHHLKATAVLQNTLERRARLNGLDAPVRIDAVVSLTTPVDEAVTALVRELDAPSDQSSDQGDQGSDTHSSADVDTKTTVSVADSGG